MQIYVAKRAGSQIFHCVLAPPCISICSGTTVKISKQGWGAGEVKRQKLRWSKLFSECVCEYENVCLHVCNYVRVTKCAFEILLISVIWLLEIIQFINEVQQKILLTSLGVLKSRSATERPLLSVRKIKENLLRPALTSTDTKKYYFHQPERNVCEGKGRSVSMTINQKQMLNILSSFNFLTIFFPYKEGEAFNPSLRGRCVFFIKRIVRATEKT